MHEPQKYWGMSPLIPTSMRKGGCPLHTFDYIVNGDQGSACVPVTILYIIVLLSVITLCKVQLSPLQLCTV